jgi:AraC-like DNA-binding protein
MVVIAKMAHAYHYLRNSNLQVGIVSALVGFQRPRALADHTKSIFGCVPSRLRAQANAQEITHALLDWLYKPRDDLTNEA